MFEDPAFSICMIRCRSWCTVDLAWAIEDAVQAGWARIALLKWLFPPSGLGAVESDVDYRLAGIIISLGMLMFVALMFMGAISGL